MTDADMRQLPEPPAEPITAGNQRETRAVAGFWLIALTLGLFLAAASAPSPLYGVYAARWHFSSTTLTAVFAVYAVALLATLLTRLLLDDDAGKLDARADSYSHVDSAANKLRNPHGHGPGRADAYRKGRGGADRAVRGPPNGIGPSAR